MMYDSKEKSDSKSEAKQSSSKAGIQRKNKNQEFQKELQLKGEIQRKQNKTGLPDHLKSGIENLSGHSMDDVKVHYNSSKPAQLNAHAYAQGNQIHLGGGQEKHLAHEAWHVVQQKQGRVKPTVNVNGAAVNDSVSLEKEADVMGGKALQMRVKGKLVSAPVAQFMSVRDTKKVVGVELAKHIKPEGEQEALATSKEKPKTTFIADDLEIKRLVDENGYNFPQETDILGYKAIVGNIKTTQWEKTGDSGAGEPVSKTKNLASRDCTVGVTKKAATDDIVINHLANVE